MAKTISKTAVTNNAPYTVVALQRTTGGPLTWIGSCLEIKGVGTESFQTAYEYCATMSGKAIRWDIDQIQDPTPIQVAARGDLRLQNAMMQIWKNSREKNCGFNILILQRECHEEARTRDANFFTRGFWLMDLRATGRYTFGNDTLVGMNAKSPQMVEDQMQFTVGSVVPFMQYEYITLDGSTPVSFFDLAIADAGRCANGDCGDSTDGCRVLVGAADDIQPMISYDGGATFVDMGTILGGLDAETSMPYSLTVINGRIFLQEYNQNTHAIATYIATLNSTLNGYTSTNAQVAGEYTMVDKYSGVLSPFQNAPVLAPDGTLVWAGSDGNVFKSTNGAVWTRIASGVQVTTDSVVTVNFVTLAVNGDVIYGIGRDTNNPATDTQTVYVVSRDSGATWNLAGYTVETTPAFLRLSAVGDGMVVNHSGILYRWDSAGIGSTSINPVGIANVMRVIPMDEYGASVLLIADGKVYRSIDGIATAALENTGLTLPGTVSTAAYAMCESITGDGAVVAMNGLLFRTRDSGLLF